MGLDKSYDDTSSKKLYTEEDLILQKNLSFHEGLKVGYKEGVESKKEELDKLRRYHDIELANRERAFTYVERIHLTLVKYSNFKAGLKCDNKFTTLLCDEDIANLEWHLSKLNAKSERYYRRAVVAEYEIEKRIAEDKNKFWNRWLLWFR